MEAGNGSKLGHGGGGGGGWTWRRCEGKTRLMSVTRWWHPHRDPSPHIRDMKCIPGCPPMPVPPNGIAYGARWGFVVVESTDLAVAWARALRRQCGNRVRLIDGASIETQIFNAVSKIRRHLEIISILLFFLVFSIITISILMDLFRFLDHDVRPCCPPFPQKNHWWFWLLIDPPKRRFSAPLVGVHGPPSSAVLYKL